MAKASIHVKRHLTRRELGTIAAALMWLAEAPPNNRIEDLRLEYGLDGEFISDDEMSALVLELIGARKVKVCRTKHKES